MLSRIAFLSALILGVSACASAGGVDNAHNAPPGEPFQQVSELVPLPDFLPGLGTLYVDPDTLPAGPFLGYDRNGQLSATVYMTPLEELADGTAYDNLPVGANNVSSVDIYYNAGHPGVEAPHVHVVLFHDDGAKQRLEE